MARWPQKLGDISIGTLLLMISAVSLIVALLLTFGLTAYIRHQALHDLARQDVEQTSKIIFQAIYAEMARGGDRRQIEAVVGQLGRTFPHLNVSFYQANIYRGPVINKQFGSLLGDELMIERDPDLKHALTEGKELLLFPTNQAVRHIYPVLGRQECLACHAQARAGQVFGLIDVTYPVHELKVPFAYVLDSMLGYTVAMLAVVFALLYLVLRKLVAAPLRQFAGKVSEIEPTLQLDRKISLRYLVAELKQLSDNFNHLLATLSGYSARLLEYSITDTLTGLYNRRAFEEHLTEEINRSNRYGGEFSLMMIDVDDFKRINDEYGHPIGDAALKQIADIMRSSLRTVDVPARLGGDEFAVILPETTAENARHVAERLHQRLNASVVATPGGSVQLTCSVGVAAYPAHVPEKSMQALLKAVDDMLYRAKHLGKNRVFMAGE